MVAGMADKDLRDTTQAVSAVFSTIGSIAIPLMIFVVGNRIATAQRAAADKQVEADRVERMLAHLVSDKADEKKLTVRVLEFLVKEGQFPSELMPALIEVAPFASS